MLAVSAFLFYTLFAGSYDQSEQIAEQIVLRHVPSSIGKLLNRRAVNLVPERAGNKVVELISGTADGWQPDNALYKSRSGTLMPQKYAATWKAHSSALHSWMLSEVIRQNQPDADYSKLAVVHFRCSDVPFCRHHAYHLLPRAYFVFAAQLIKAAGIKRVVLMSCQSRFNNGAAPIRVHPYMPTKLYFANQTVARERCLEYRAVIEQWLKAEELEILPTICPSRPMSWSVMASCGLLVSTGGTFSFVPGVSKPPGRFVSPRFALEEDLDSKQSKGMAKHVHWDMWTGDPIWHRQVQDYRTFDYSMAAG
jgi:hypothetical protein